MSTVARSLMLLSRLNAVLSACDPTVIPSFNGRFSRKWFAEQIECAVATLSSSTRLRRALNHWENQQNASLRHSRPPQFSDDRNVSPLSPKGGFGIIRLVPTEMNERTYLVPTLLWNDGYDEWVNDYIRYVLLTMKNKFTSAGQTVKNLRLFRRFLFERNLDFTDVNDDILITWQNGMIKKNISVDRRNELISTVHDFFKWAERTGRVWHKIQLAARDEYPVEMEQYKFPITSELIEVRGKGGQTYLKWVSTLFEKGGHSSHGRRHTPNGPEVEKLFLEIERHGRNIARNELLVSWPLETGIRVSEIVQLMASDFPDPDSVMQLYEADAPQYYEVKVERKNRGVSTLRVPRDLVLRTVDFIWNDVDRNRIIETHCRGRNDVAVFVSETTGEAFDTDSITRICRHFFKLAGIKKANIHRLRARYITEVFEYQLDMLSERGFDPDPTTNWQETILTTAVELMGHSHRISLLPYLNECLQRRMTSDGAIEPRSIAVREEAMRRLSGHMAARLHHHRPLIEADKLIADGRYAEATHVLGQVIQGLEALHA